MTAPSANQPVEHAGVAKSLRTVAFGLLGVAANQQDLTDGSPPLSPLKIVIIALVFMAFFVGGLVTLATRIASG